MMASKLRLPTLGFAALSFCLSIAIIGCAGRALDVFDREHKSNVWFLPIWRDHFDISELQALVGTSTAVVVLNGLLAASLFVTAVSSTHHRLT